MTIPSAAARTGVFCGEIKSIAFLRDKIWAGDKVLSIFCRVFWYRYPVGIVRYHPKSKYLFYSRYIGKNTLNSMSFNLIA